MSAWFCRRLTARPPELHPIDAAPLDHIERIANRDHFGNGAIISISADDPELGGVALRIDRSALGHAYPWVGHPCLYALGFEILVRAVGLETTRRCHRGILSLSKAGSLRFP